MTKRSFVDSFNARHLSAEDVARTYVDNEAFGELWENNNAVLLGPRGSGKTTLLKMLTAPALYTWSDERAEAVRSEIAFRAVYIPTDVHWQHQLRHSTQRLAESPSYAQRVSEVAVTTNVLYSLSEAFQGICRYECDLSPAVEAKLCRLLINEWRLPATTAPLLEGVMGALMSRVNDLYVWTNRAAASEFFAADPSSMPDHYFLDYYPATAVACEAFDALIPFPIQRRWALCFDELELAPQWLQGRLFDELRSSDQRFLFKLSTSPTPQRGYLSGATERNDFRAIRLWPHSHNDPKRFSESLASSIIARRCGPGVTPESLFGSSPWSGSGDEHEYARGSSTWAAIKKLAEYDYALRETLERFGLDPDDPSTDDISLRDQVLRKAKPLVLFRRAFTKPSPDGTLSIRRSRKVPTLYSGKEAIYSIADGNPRWLIGIVDDLITRSRRGDAPPRRIAPHLQAGVLKRIAEQFGALIQALPDAAVDLDGKQITLYGLLSWIGDWFFRTLVQRPFTLDPHGSFLVDSETPSVLFPLLRIAVYEGAIILVDPDDNAIGPDLIGKRFRISYRLAPAFRLPLRLYDAIPLSRCLSEHARTSREPRPNITHRTGRVIQEDLELEQS